MKIHILNDQLHFDISLKCRLTLVLVAGLLGTATTAPVVVQIFFFLMEGGKRSGALDYTHLGCSAAITAVHILLLIAFIAFPIYFPNLTARDAFVTA